MSKYPAVLIYSLEDKPIWLTSKSGNLGTSNLISFTYKFSETEPDEGELRLGFTTFQFDNYKAGLNLLQPGIGLKIRWGYHGGAMTPAYEVAVKDAEYDYSKAGYIVSLKFIALAEYKSEGLLRNPEGDVLEDLVIDTAEGVGRTYEYESRRGDKFVAVEDTSDGKLKLNTTIYDPSGQSRVLEVAKESGIKQAESSEEKKFIQWGSNYENLYGKDRQYVASLAHVHGPAGTIPFVNKTQQVVLGPQLLAEAWFKVWQTTGSSKRFSARGKDVDISGTNWLANPSRYYSVGRDIISYRAEKSDKEARVTGAIATHLDPTTAEILSDKVVVGASFYTARVDSKNPTKAITSKMWASGSSYYMQDVDNAGELMGDPVEITRDTYQARQKQSLEFEQLRVKGEGQMGVDAIAKGEDLGELIQEREEWRNQYLRNQVEMIGFPPWAIDKGLIKVKYSGRTKKQILDSMVKNEMDKIFYNLKLTLKVEGDPLVSDKINIGFVGGSDVIDGVYHVDESEHNISKAGYVMSLVSYRIVDNYDRITNQKKVQLEEGLKAAYGEDVTEEDIANLIPLWNNALLKGETVSNENLAVENFHTQTGMGAPYNNVFQPYDEKVGWFAKKDAYIPSKFDSTEVSRQVRKSQKETILDNIDWDTTFEENKKAADKIVLSDTLNPQR